MTAVAELECPPLHLWVPPHFGSHADEVGGLAESVGMPLDPEQLLLPEIATAYDEQGRLVAPSIGCCAPRQNIKTHGGKMLSLADLVLFRVPQSAWTAHLRETSDDAFRNPHGTGLADLFDNFDFLRRLVEDIVDRDNVKQIILKPKAVGLPRPTLTFAARSEGRGRGITGNRVTYDEALYLKPSMVSSMLPILSAQSMTGQVQVRYLGSPGLLRSAVWRGVRDRGRAGGDMAMAWLEFGTVRPPCLREDCTHAVDVEGCVLDREDLVRAANLSIGRRMHIRFATQTERRDMTPGDYGRERMGWWEDPPNLTGGDLDTVRWAVQTDFDVKRGKPISYGVDVDGDGIAWIGMAWRRPDGGVQVMLDEPADMDRRRVSAMTAPARLKELVASYGGSAALGGPASRIESDLKGVKTRLITGGEFASACASFIDLLKAGRIWHQEQDELDLAVQVAKLRNVGTAGEQAWQLQGASGIGPLAAVTRALAGLLLAPSVSPAEPLALSTSGEGGITDPIADMTF